MKTYDPAAVSSLTRWQRVGTWVHVRTHDGGTPWCAPALVMSAGRDDSIRARVVHPTPVGRPIGEQDAEAWYQGRAVVFANPDGSSRPGDTWHPVDHCPYE